LRRAPITGVLKKAIRDGYKSLVTPTRLTLHPIYLKLSESYPTVLDRIRPVSTETTIIVAPVLLSPLCALWSFSRTVREL
jgi:hypothetical protein